MGSTPNKQAGFGVIEVIVVILIVALVAGIGWYVYDRMNRDDESSSETSAQIEEAPQVGDESGLMESERYLEDLDIDGQLDTSELDEAISS